MPCSSPLKQLQTSFQKPSGWGSPPTMTHRTVLLILHIFQYWLWLNTLMGRPKYIINELAFSFTNCNGQAFWCVNQPHKLAVQLDVPKQVGRPACFKPSSASRSIQHNHSLQQSTRIILWGKQRCAYDLERGETWPWKSACFTKPDPSKPSFFQQLRAVFLPLWHQLRFGTPGLMIERVWEID